MPNLTLTIEDTSPLLVYSPEWEAGTSRNDSLIELYSLSSYMYTTTADASVFFVFSGTNVNIFGGKRPRNGFYQIAVDTKVYTPVNGQTGQGTDPGLFQTSLFSSIPLSNAQHTVQLKNANAGSVVDLDYVTWTAPVGRDDEELIVNTFDDADSLFKYEPADAWTTNPNNLGTFSGGTGHASSKSGSTMKFTFEGDAVSLYGPVGSNGALYSVSIDKDNGLPNNYTTKRSFYRPNMMLYHANKLGPGPHTVTLTVLAENSSTGESSVLAIDYAHVYTTPSLGGVRLSAGGRPQGLSAGAVAGVTLGAVAGVVILIVLFFWGIICYQQKRHNRTFFYGFTENSMEEKKNELNAHPFRYSTVPTTGSPPATQQTLQSQVSNGSLVPTPNTGQWPPSSGQDSIETSISQRPLLHQASNPNVQEIIIPPSGMSEKMRRELAPRLQPPPQGTRPRQNPAALGAQYRNVSTVQEESAGGSNLPNLTVITDTDDPALASAPPPEYTQQAAPSTAASSFYAREGFRGQ